MIFSTPTALLARALVRRRRRVDALAVGGLADPVALSRLELHRAALTAFEQRPATARAFPVEHMRSLLATGAADAMLDVARGLKRGSGREPALTVARADPGLALDLYGGGEVEIAAALEEAGGRSEAALARLQGVEGVGADLLRASLHRGDPGLNAKAWADAFAGLGLASPEPVDPAKAISVANVRAAPAPERTGPLVTVIMPAYNTAAYVGAAVRSILDQSWRNLELLVADDGSSDDTIRLARAAAGGDARFRVLPAEGRGGPYRARNRALAEARGVFVAFHDADEWSHPERLAIQVGAMERDGLMAVSHRGIRVADDGGLHARGVWPAARWAPSTLMIRRDETLRAAGLMDEVRNGADNEYWWRLSLLFGAARVRIRPAPLILGAWRPDSLTVAAESGFGAKGYNLDRLDYWEGWNLWHLACRRDPGRLKLDRGDRPFDIPPGLRLDTLT